MLAKANSLMAKPMDIVISSITISVRSYVGKELYVKTIGMDLVSKPTNKLVKDSTCSMKQNKLYLLILFHYLMNKLLKSRTANSTGRLFCEALRALEL